MLNKIPVYGLIALVLTACGGSRFVRDESGDGAQYQYLSLLVPKQEYLDRERKQLTGPLSPNNYDYASQYYLQFVSDISRSGEVAAPGTGGAWAVARNVGGAIAAADIVGSRVFGSPSRFGNGFNVAMIGLSVIAPRSPEETFVGWAKHYYADFLSPSVTFIKVDQASENISDDDVDRVFSARFLEMRSVVRSAGFSCDDEKENVMRGLYRESSALRSTCVFHGKTIKFTRKSLLSMQGSIVREMVGPSIVSKVTFANIDPSLIAPIIVAHSQLYGKGWVSIYPEFSGGIASKIVVSQGGLVKKFDPPRNPLSGS